MRHCSICTKALPPIDLFCDDCWEKLARVRNGSDGLKPLLQGGSQFPVYSLFTWTKETEPLVRPMVHALKRAWSPRAVERLGEWFSFERTRAGKVEFEVLVPAPGDGFDHARAWAETLSSRLGRPTMDVLQKPSHEVGQQRTRSAAERSELRLTLKTNQFAREGKFIFADDVITTGSTAMAAYMALGDPKHYEVWTMVNRPRVATLDAL